VVLVASTIATSALVGAGPVVVVGGVFASAAGAQAVKRRAKLVTANLKDRLEYMVLSSHLFHEILSHGRKVICSTRLACYASGYCVMNFY